ncbi:MAG: sulfite dehydrogenase [Nitrospirales bacterium]|nr:sulfite dehydrogenase [Nitrospirales bacterium]
MRAKKSPASKSKQSLSRRHFLLGATSLLGVTASQVLLPVIPASSQPASQDPMRVPGGPASVYGRRSVHEQAQRLPSATRSLTPLQDLHGIITPSALHFERHHNGVPLIDPAQHRLLIHGLVERPMLFQVDELKLFPAVSRLGFIECSGNTGKEWKRAHGKTAQETHGLTSTSEWTGVMLKTLLEQTGVKPEGLWLLAEGSDAAAMTRSFPVEAIIDEAVICYAQNGEPLRPEQGYPLRLLLPGWEGNTNIKWVRRLKLIPGPAMTREETAKYTDLMPDGVAQQFTFVMEAKSVITHPSGNQRIPKPGFVEIRGLAWSGRGAITAVEVSVDGGHTWRTAELQGPVLPKCHTRFRLAWQWDGKEAILQSRCIDDTGYRQPTLQELVKVRGTNSYYHNHAIQSWKVLENGHVENVYIR